MARITSEQDAAIDVLDRVLFNQILVFCAFSESERDWLAQITESVSQAVCETGVAGLQAECVKHSVLCFMEIILADGNECLAKRSRVPLSEGVSWEDFLKVDMYKRDFFAAFALSVWTEFRGDVMRRALDIAENLVEVFRDAPVTVRYRLSERCLAYEFQRAPVDCLVWLAKFGLIRTTKYRSDRAVISPKYQALARIGLLCEFEVLRKTVRSLTQDKINSATIMLENMAKNLSSGAEARLQEIEFFLRKQASRARRHNDFVVFFAEKVGDKAYVNAFFEELSKHLVRFRILKKSQANLVGDLGAVLVEIARDEQSNKAIYNDLDNEKTLTYGVMIDFRDRGLAINARTLLEKRRCFKENTLKLIFRYHKAIAAFATAPNPVMDDLYHYFIIPHADEQLSKYAVVD